MANVLLLNGPNLNLLGTREPGRYGTTSLRSLEQSLTDQAHSYDLTLTCRQSNAESELLDFIHQALQQSIAFILINPAALAHTSIALRDALLAVAIPFIEIHITNIYQRENFRQQSYLSDIAHGVITGFGIHGYALALNAAHHYLFQCNKKGY